MKEEKTIETIVDGETLLATIRNTANDTFQIEIAEFVKNPNAKQNVAANFMEGHSAFNNVSSKPRRAYQTATAEGIMTVFGIDTESLTFDDINGKSVAQINVLNPELNGERLHIRIVDGLEPFFEGQSPKQIVNEKGEVTYFMKENQHIYSITQIVAGEPEHDVIKSDARLKANEINTNVETEVASMEGALNP